MTVPRILIVDDDPALLEALPETLRLRMGAVAVDLAESGVAALERIRAADYDAVVADVRMPGMDGLALLNEIRALRSGVPTLLVTGHGEHELAIEALRRGAYDYVQKPIDREYFIASLRRAIETRQLMRQVEEQRHALERYANEQRQKVQALTDVAATIHEARSVTEVIQSVAKAGTRLTGGTTFAAFLRNHANGGSSVAENPGVPEDAHTDGERWDVVGWPPEPKMQSASHGSHWLWPVLDAAVEASRTIEAHEVSIHDDDAFASCMVVPIKTRREKVLGAILLGHAEPGHFTSDTQPQIEALAQQAAVALENALYHERQRGIAETLQLSLLPDHLPNVPGMALAARYVPGSTEAVGGDWYDVFPLPKGQLGLVIGDVAGRGVRAAAITGLLRNALRAYALDGHSPEGVASRLNDLVDVSHMATLIYLVCDPATWTVRYVNLGHVPPLVIAPQAEPVFLEGGSPPLGADARLPVVEHTATLAPDSVLLLYTDGLVEVRGERLNEGMERLNNAVRRARSSVGDLDSLIGEILSCTFSARRMEDDVALLAMRALEPDPARFTLKVPAVPAALATLRHSLRRWLDLLDATEEEMHEVTVAASEAVNNAVEHAFGPREAVVEIEAFFNGGEIEIVVRDSGTWRPPRGENRGRGLQLMHGLMHAVEVTHGAGGTTVRMRRALRDAAPSREDEGG